MSETPEKNLQDLIDEVDNLDSERPSQIEIVMPAPLKSIRPKIPDSWPARVVAVILALASIAAAVREILK